MWNSRGRIAVGVLLSLVFVGEGLGFDPANGNWSKSDSDDIRVMTWNVLDAIRRTNDKQDIANNWNAIVRIIATIQPDILIVQEAGDNTTQGEVGGVDTVNELTTVLELMMHGGADPFEGVQVTSYVQLFAPGYDMPFIFVNGITDNFNRNFIMSRFPFGDLNGDGRDSYNDIPFVSPDLYAPGGDGDLRGFQFAELDLPDSIYLGDLVVGGAHLKAGGSNSDEMRRRVAAQNVAYVMDYWYNGAGTGMPDPNGKILDSPAATTILGDNTPIVIGGDWNEDEATNGQRGPALWLTAAEFTGGTDGTDRDRTDMILDNPTDQFTGSTITRPASGRKLDYLAWQDSIATLRRSFVFNTVVMGGVFPPDVASYPGVPSQANSIASDHLPVVVDLIVPANRSGMVISEIMYNPNSSEAAANDVEWVEVFNTSDVAVDLNGWSLSDEDGSTGLISGVSVVASGEAAVLIPDAQSVADFQAAWGSGYPIFRLSNWSSMGLENDPSGTNEVLALRNIEGIVEDIVNFDDEGDWPVDSPDGASIYVLLGHLTLDGNNDGNHWARSVVGVDDAVANTVTVDFDGSDVGSPGSAPKCTLAAECDDGVFCDGDELCVGFTCIEGVLPCSGQLCDEGGDVCVDCLSNQDCADALFCNGVELCDNGTCGPGSDPCPGQLCNEASDSCVDCFFDSECDNGIFCDGVEDCVFGACISLGDPCAPFPCLESTVECGCLAGTDCDDGLFCNGVETCGLDARCAAGTRPCLDTEFCDEFADGCVEGSRMILVAAGDDPAATTPGQDAMVGVSPGDTLTVEVYLQDQTDLMGGFEVSLACSPVSSVLAAPNLDFVPSSVVVDTARPDYVFLSLDAFPVIDQGQCDGSIPCTSSVDCPPGNSSCDIGGTDMCTVISPRAGAVLSGGATVFPNGVRYLGQMDFVVPPDAEGEYTISPVCTPEDGCPSVLTVVRDLSFFALPFTADGLVVVVETGKCCVAAMCTPDLTAGECDVLGGTFSAGLTCDGVDPCACIVDCDCIDSDVCTNNQCEGGLCVSKDVRYGDVLEPFTSLVATSDILCAVNGFGNYCDCPNADIDGCVSSGVPISTGDILEVVRAFGGADPCGCGVPLAASAASVVFGPRALLEDRHSQPKVIMVPRARSDRANGRVVVDLFVSDVTTMVGYEVSMVAIDRNGEAVLPLRTAVDDDRGDYVFAGLHQAPLTDATFGRVGALVQAAAPAVRLGERAYLGTFEFELSEKAAGSTSFRIGETGALFWNASRERSSGVLSVK